MSAGEHPSFPVAARAALADTQLRHNLAHATHSIRDKRAAVVSELPDWEQLREAGRGLKERVMRHLDDHLLQFEAAVSAAGGTVHWRVTARSATGSWPTSSPPRGSMRSSR